MSTGKRPINPWFVAVTVTLATFMELLDTSIANVALPYIGGGLGRSYDEVTWNPPLPEGTFVQAAPAGMPVEPVDCN